MSGLIVLEKYPSHRKKDARVGGTAQRSPQKPAAKLLIKNGVQQMKKHANTTANTRVA